MRRREFITLAGGIAVAWPLSARAQRVAGARRIGMLIGFDDPEIKVFQQELERLGWSEGHNVRIDHRYAPAGAQVNALAKELIALQPDVIFAQSRPVTAALQQETKTIPIVFTFVTDPVGAGFIKSLRQPGGNITGLEVWEPGIVGKWLTMLKEISPQIARVAVLGNPKTAAYYDYLFRAAVADRHHLPVVYPYRFFVTSGGLMAYTVANGSLYRQAASYVDQILHGAKPNDIPVQTPTKYETVVNLKTAKALGLIVPPGLLVAADEVIE